MDIVKTLGSRIRLLRIHKGMQQKDLASVLGCPQSELSDWETGKRLIPTKYLLKLPDIFDVNLDFFNTKKEIVFKEVNVEPKNRKPDNILKKTRVKKVKLQV